MPVRCRGSVDREQENRKGRHRMHKETEKALVKKHVTERGGLPERGRRGGTGNTGKESA